MTEHTLTLIKPDGVSCGLIGEVISRIEHKGLKLVALDLYVADETIAKEHYVRHVDKPSFGELVDFITLASLVAGAIEGPNTITARCQFADGTNPTETAIPGSTHDDSALRVANNVVHGSDSPKPVKREIGTWFPDL